MTLDPPPIVDKRQSRSSSHADNEPNALLPVGMMLICVFWIASRRRITLYVGKLARHRWRHTYKSSGDPEAGWFSNSMAGLASGAPAALWRVSRFDVAKFNDAKFGFNFKLNTTERPLTTGVDVSQKGITRERITRRRKKPKGPGDIRTNDGNTIMTRVSEQLDVAGLSGGFKLTPTTEFQSPVIFKCSPGVSEKTTPVDKPR